MTLGSRIVYQETRLLSPQDTRRRILTAVLGPCICVPLCCRRTPWGRLYETCTYFDVLIFSFVATRCSFYSQEFKQLFNLVKMEVNYLWLWNWLFETLESRIEMRIPVCWCVSLTTVLLFVVRSNSIYCISLVLIRASDQFVPVLLFWFFIW